MQHARILFVQEDLLVEAPVGAALPDIAEACSADITFGCRSGSCGTCRIRVARGIGHCSPMTAEERDFLQSLGAPGDQRLACQVRVEGDLEIEYLGVEP